MSNEEHGPPTPRVPELVADPVPVRQPWDKRKDENDQQWDAFKLYRDMHPRRIPRGAKFFGEMKVSSWTVAHWCTQFDWAARADAYDVMLDRITQEHHKKVVAETAESLAARGLNAALIMLEVSTLELEKFAEVARNGGAPGLVKPADLKGWLEASVKIIRLIKGETTENIGTGGLSERFSKLPLEEVRRLRVKSDQDLAEAEERARAAEAEEEAPPSQRKRFRA